MFGSFPGFLGAFRSGHILAGDDFGELDEETTFRHVVEYIQKFLLFVFYQLADLGFFHHPTVYFRIVIHLFEGYFLFLFPIVVADEERGHLVVGITR